VVEAKLRRGGAMQAEAVRQHVLFFYGGPFSQFHRAGFVDPETGEHFEPAIARVIWGGQRASAADNAVFRRMELPSFRWEHTQLAVNVLNGPVVLLPRTWDLAYNIRPVGPGYRLLLENADRPAECPVTREDVFALQTMVSEVRIRLVFDGDGPLPETYGVHCTVQMLSPHEAGRLDLGRYHDGRCFGQLGMFGGRLDRC